MAHTELDLRERRTIEDMLNAKVTVRAMSTDDNSDDIWTGRRDHPRQPSEPNLQTETIEDVEPLDDQFGVDTPLTVPFALQDVLFGQPEPVEAGNDPAPAPALHTYAILDAAKVLNLPEMLDASGLPHRCLFKGDAFDELKDAAPWIVRLEDGNAFTRNLFTRSDAPWHLWDREPGIYVRSRGTLDDMWKHFRKFTRVQDENGKWYYFRFWEGVHIGAMLQEMDPKDQIKFFMDCRVESILAIQAAARPNVLKMSLRST